MNRNDGIPIRSIVLDAPMGGVMALLGELAGRVGALERRLALLEERLFPEYPLVHAESGEVVDVSGCLSWCDLAAYYDVRGE